MRKLKAVDLFAGVGGFTQAARELGIEVAEAHNHWQFAVDLHAKNHPNTKHVCQDLKQANFHKLPDFDLLLASPACQPHSEASQPNRREYHDEMRATAWAVTECVEAKEPEKFIVENVQQFAEWKLYPLWLESLRLLGYKVTTTVACATSFGEAQLRKRLFIVGSRRKAIHIDVPPPKAVPFGPLVDWNADDWKLIKDCEFPNAKSRLMAAASRFDTALVQHVTGHKGISLDEPIRTVTTKVQWCLMWKKKYYRYLTPRELARAQGFPDSYYLGPGTSKADEVKAIGNAVSVKTAKGLIRQVAAA